MIWKVLLQMMRTYCTAVAVAIQYCRCDRNFIVLFSKYRPPALHAHSLRSDIIRKIPTRYIRILKGSSTREILLTRYPVRSMDMWLNLQKLAQLMITEMIRCSDFEKIIGLVQNYCSIRLAYLKSRYSTTYLTQRTNSG